MPTSGFPIFIRVFLAAALFGVGAAAGGLLVSTKDEVPPGETEVEESLASPHLSPEQVVKVQLDAAIDSLNDPQRLVECYSLSSPRHRSENGPIERFAEMLFSPPYDHLADCASWQVGSAVVNGRVATVLVSVLATDGSTHAYRFYLSKQDRLPYENCWMTDAVVALMGVEFESADQNYLSSSGLP